MDEGSGLKMYDVVVKCSRSLSHFLMSSCFFFFTPVRLSSRGPTMERYQYINLYKLYFTIEMVAEI